MSSVRFPIALMCTTASYGGIELNTLRLARWMRERGWSCTLVGAKGSPLLAAAEDAFDTIALDRPKKYLDIRNARHLAHALMRRSVRVLIANATRDLNTAVCARGFSRGRLRLVSVQHMQIGVDKRDALHRWHFARVDAWVAPLPSLAHQTLARTTMPPARVHVIPFGIETTKFVTDRTSAGWTRAQGAIRAALALDIPASEPLIGVVGRLDRGKGQEHLVDALALLARDGINAHALIVGEDTRGEHQEYGRLLADRVHTHGIGARVHFRPFTEDVAAVYHAMDVFALTSLAETYGMVTIEAMASGLPVVATRSGGTPDLIRDEDTGLLVPPGDPRALGDALARLIRDPAAAARMGRRAAADACARFSHGEECCQYERLLEELIAGAGG